MIDPQYQTREGIIFSDEQEGAVNLHECPSLRRCCCGVCEVCGNPKHTAVHGPCLGGAPGSKPWGHTFRNQRSQP